MAQYSNGKRGRANSRARQAPRRTSSFEVNKSITSRRKERKAAQKAAKAEYLASLPKDRWKRLAARLHPRHLIRYWFSREGAVMGLKIIGIIIVGCFFLVVGMFAYFRKDILAFNNISGANLGGSISYYDSTGKVLLWTDYNSVKRIPVQSDQISPYVKEATVAIEDKGFYHEGGFDIGSIFRSTAHDLIHHGEGLEGASTITEQVVKLNKGWQDPLTIQEKLEEIGLSVALSRDYTKDQILTSYLNIVPYGNIDYGIEAAAEDYFRTSASNLTLAQAAMLAAIPQAPTEYSPYSSPEYNPAVSTNLFNSIGLVARQHYVLELMEQQHMITKAQEQAAAAVNVLAEVKPVEGKYQNIHDPYFVLEAKQQLINTYGTKLVDHGSWKVITTLQVPLQNLAQELVTKNLPNAEANGANEEALVAEQTKTGQVVAYIGGTNFKNPQYGQINYASININPGSTIKPYVYSTFINNSKNVGAGSVLYDVQQPLPGYPCTNKNLPSDTTDPGNCLEDYDFRYPGAETIRYALAGSRNVPAVKAGLEAGLPAVEKEASLMMGYSDAYRCYAPNANVFTAGPAQQVPCYGAAAIGNGYLQLDQTVNGLATLGRLGQEVPQTYILSIQDSTGHYIYQWKQPKPNQALKTDTAYIMDNMLSDPRASYLPGSCSSYTCTPLSEDGYKWQRYNGWDIAVKTGTTNSNQSGLMAGWNTQYAVISWAAYDTVNTQLTAGAMEYITEPMTRGWMEGALDMLKTKPVNWVQPSDIKVLPSYVQAVHVGVGSEEPGPSEDIFPSWYDGKGTATYQVIDKVSGGIATSCTPADAKEYSYTGSATSFSVDTFWPINQSSSSSQSSTTATTYDDVHNCSDQPPQITLTAPQTCSNTDNDGKGCAITVTATQGTHPLGGGYYGGTIKVSVNGKLVRTFYVSNSPSTETFYYSPTTSGTVDVSATVTDSVLYQTTQATQMQTIYTPGTTNGTTDNGAGGNNGSPTTGGTGGGNP